MHASEGRGQISVEIVSTSAQATGKDIGIEKGSRVVAAAEPGVVEKVGGHAAVTCVAWHSVALFLQRIGALKNEDNM